MMAHAAESATEATGMLGDDLSRYLAQNCLMCERRSPRGLHLTCVVLSHLTAVRTTTQWVSHEMLREAVGVSEDLHADMARVRSAVCGLRHRGWNIANGRQGYRLT